MKNFEEESRTKKHQKHVGRINYASDHQTPIYDQTSQMKAPSKIEITITREQLIAAKWLFHQYELKPPSWLRQKFYINQRRRKCLNAELTESQLDKVYCDHRQNPEDWDGLLHQLWHQANGVSSCK